MKADLPPKLKVIVRITEPDGKLLERFVVESLVEPEPTSARLAKAIRNAVDNMTYTAVSDNGMFGD